MPGTSHQFESRILESLPIKYEAVVVRLLNFCALEEMVMLLEHGPTDELRGLFPNVKPEDWPILFRKVTAARITYLEVNNNYSLEQLTFLVDLLAECLSAENASQAELALVVNPNHEYLRFWLKRTFALIKAKTKSKQPQNA